MLSTESLARFVRLPPGQEVRFTWVDPGTAQARLRAAVGAIEVAVVGRVLPSSQTLGAANLIDGVTDGATADA